MKIPVIHHRWMRTINGMIQEKPNLENMDTQEMKDAILSYVKKQYLDDEDLVIDYDTHLISSGYVDSFSMVSLLVYIENKFKIKIPPGKATPEAFDTVNNIVALVNQHL